MATDEHKRLATVIKEVHESLRKASKIMGPERAWQEHLKDSEKLQIYSKAMENLAGMWEDNAIDQTSGAQSRISWIIDFCIGYFLTDKLILDKRSKEEHLNEACQFDLDLTENYLPDRNKIRLLDVGSCFNPFKKVDFFDVFAMDLCPANESVYKGDFLKIGLSDDANPLIEKNEVREIPKSYFDCVVFSLLLEYMPSSEQRISCCSKAYELLRFEGILIVITPDSQHVGKNAKIMKNWRYTLAKMGFSRIKFDKLPHITCLVFRKCLAKCFSDRWANIHKEDYMEFCLNTPQDFNDYGNKE